MKKEREQIEIPTEVENLANAHVENYEADILNKLVTDAVETQHKKGCKCHQCSKQKEVMVKTKWGRVYDEIERIDPDGLHYDEEEARIRKMEEKKK